MTESRRSVTAVATAGAFVYVLWRIVTDTRATEREIQRVGRLMSKRIETTVLDRRFMRGDIDLVTYERELAAVWGLDGS